MKLIKLLFLLLTGYSGHAQIQTIWETNHPVGNDSLEILFYKQDSVGNHYTGGAIGLTFFVTKFDANGVHQWTKSGDLNLNSFPEYPYFDTQTIDRSWFSDIVIKDSILYLAGTKQYPQPQSLNKNSFNFILKLNSNGDSLGFRNVVKDDIPISQLWGENGYNPIIRMVDNQVYYFTSMFSGKAAFGSVNITAFKYDENLNRLEYKIFDGTQSSSIDRLLDVKLIGNIILINSSIGGLNFNSQIRNLICDSLLNPFLIDIYGIRGSVLMLSSTFSLSLLSDSLIYNISTLVDTAKKRPTPDYYGRSNHIRKYNANSGQLLDSVVFNESSSSDNIFTDALLHNGSIYISGVSIDSGVKKVFLYKFDNNLKLLQKISFDKKLHGDVLMESNDCKLYVSLIDSSLLGLFPVIIRLDENLNVLSEQSYSTGKDKLISFTTKVKDIQLLSIGKRNNNDTISLKFLSDTLNIVNPSEFNAEAINPTTVKLSWNLQNGISDSVEILKSINGEDWQYLQTLSSLDTAFTDSGLMPSTRHYYSITARWKNEYSCNSLYASDSTPFNTSIHSLANTEVWIFPNPASGDLHISTTLPDFEYTLYDISGIIKLSGHNATKLKVQHLQAGIYYLSIKTTDQQIHHFKIIKL